MRIVGSNRHRAVVFDVNLATGFFTQTADRGTALTDHVTDLFRIDLEGEQTRSPNGEFLGAVAGHFVHLAEDVHAAFVSLSQSSLHDFGRDTFNLDVHLKSGHTFSVPAT